MIRLIGIVLLSILLLVCPVRVTLAFNSPTNTGVHDVHDSSEVQRGYTTLNTGLTTEKSNTNTNTAKTPSSSSPGGFSRLHQALDSKEAAAIVIEGIASLLDVFTHNFPFPDKENLAPDEGTEDEEEGEEGEGGKIYDFDEDDIDDMLDVFDESGEITGVTIHQQVKGFTELIAMAFGWDIPYERRVITFLDDLKGCGLSKITRADIDDINKRHHITKTMIREWDKGNISVGDAVMIYNGMVELDALVENKSNFLQRACIKTKLSLQQMTRIKRVEADAKVTIKHYTGLSEPEVSSLMQDLPYMLLDVLKVLDMAIGKDVSWKEKMKFISDTTKLCGRELKTADLAKIEKETGVTKEITKQLQQGVFSSEAIMAVTDFHNLLRTWLHEYMSESERQCVYDEMGDAFIDRLRVMSDIVVDSWSGVIQRMINAKDRQYREKRPKARDQGRFVETKRLEYWYVDDLTGKEGGFFCDERGCFDIVPVESSGESGPMDFESNKSNKTNSLAPEISGTTNNTDSGKNSTSSDTSSDKGTNVSDKGTNVIFKEYTGWDEDEEKDGDGFSVGVGDGQGGGYIYVYPRDGESTGRVIFTGENTTT